MDKNTFNFDKFNADLDKRLDADLERRKLLNKQSEEWNQRRLLNRLYSEKHLNRVYFK